MKISKVILTLASILLILGLIAVIFPKNGVQVGGLNLQFPSLNEVFFEEKPQYADIDSIVEQEEEEKSEDKETKQVKIKEDNLVDIELPENNPMYLDNFFASLDSINTYNNKVRVIHYGDSQIESDRITSYIRNRLQGEFGGEGQGQIPLYSLSNVKNVTFTYSNGWDFYSIIDNKKTSFHNYGLMQSAVKFISENHTDSLGNETIIQDSVIITLNFARAVSGDITLYYQNTNESLEFDFFTKEKNLLNGNIQTANGLSKIPVTLKEPIKTLTMQFKGEVELYSLDFSSKSGVYVDNVSLRGSSGWGFNKNNAEFLKSMSEKLNVRLLILQFGVNAVPQNEQEIMPSYQFYKVQLVKQINFLKKTNPNAAIIVIGISDRSRKKSNGYETNPNIPMILAAQQNAAKECGVAFWNLFEAMGGENSMPSWVLREKPLANTDFTHFNDRGAKYVGEMFYKALENAYINYKNK